MCIPSINVNPEETEKAVGQAVANLTGGLTKAVGNTFSDLWYLAFGGLDSAAEKKRIRIAQSIDQYKERLESKINDIPPEKRMGPSMQIVGTALEKSKYCVEEPVLREMFANLIAASLSSDTVNLVQPCFSSIIEQLSPLDASNLALFKTPNLPIAAYELALIPNGYQKELDNVFCAGDATVSLENHAVSISSLDRLGLITLDYDRPLLDKEGYKAFEKTDYYLSLSKAIQEGKFPNVSKVDITNGIASITPLGKAFITVCC